MTVNRFLCLVVAIAIVSCVVKTNEESNLQDEKQNSDENVPFYISTSVSSSTGLQPDSDKWRCGVEYIAEKGPQGEIIVVEVPMICDPFADIYMGDPAPEKPQEKETKKAPYETGPDLSE